MADFLICHAKPHPEATGPDLADIAPRPMMSPACRPPAFDAVIVNGALTWWQGAHQGTKAGQVVTRVSTTLQ
jgi:N-acyl-D-amino-acid deacylase